jgi:hypothetical protein
MALKSDFDVFQGDEGRHLKAFLAAPDNPAMLHAYLSFLDATDPSRAEMLRFAVQLRQAQTAAEARAWNARKPELEARLRGAEHTWWQVVNPYGSVRLCGASDDARPRVRFAFQCPKTWQSLAATDQRKVRECGECRQRVFQCDTPDEVRERAQLGQCIFVPLSVARDARRENDFGYLGRPDPIQCLADAVLGR